jgi:drug/metabolite transporter (DMT)-like permease
LSDAPSGARSVTPYLLLTLACLFWASVFVLGRATRDTIPPMSLTLLRHVVAAGVLLALAWRPLRTEWRLLLASWRWILVLGLMAIGLFPALLLLALARTTALNGSLINSIQPVMTVGLAYLAIREPVSPRQAAGIILSLAGVVVIATRGAPGAASAIDLNTGDLLVMLCLFLWSLYSIGLRHIPASLSPSVLALAIVLTGLPFSVPFMAMEVAGGRIATFDATTLGAIVYFGVFPSALALLFWNRGVAALGPNRSAIFVHLIPVFGAIMAIAFLGETPRPYHAVGIAVVIAGVWLTTSGRRATA